MPPIRSNLLDLDLENEAIYRNHGWRTQEALIRFVIKCVGEKAVYSFGTQTRKVGIVKSAIDAWNKNHELAPESIVKPKTAYLWLRHHVEYGECPEATRKRVDKRKACRRSKWGYHETLRLKLIIDEEPWLYLDEIQGKLLEQTGMKFCTSSIHRRLTKMLRYSLKLVSEKAIQRSSQERLLYNRYREHVLRDMPETAVFIDETHCSTTNIDHASRTLIVDSGVVSGR